MRTALSSAYLPPPRRAGVARVELIVFIFTVIFVAAALLLWARSQTPLAPPAPAPRAASDAALLAELTRRSNEIARLSMHMRSLTDVHTSLLARIDASVDTALYRDLCRQLEATREELRAAQARIDALAAAAQSAQDDVAARQRELADQQQELERLRATLAARTTPATPAQSAAAPAAVVPSPYECQYIRTNAALLYCPQPRRAPTSWLERRWLGGMCHGGLRLVTAPVLVPYGVVRGVTSPFWSDPEMGGDTNYALFAAAQTVVAPLALTWHSVVGAGTCGGDTLRGCGDIVTLGHYGVIEEQFVSTRDYRPYLLQLLATDWSSPATPTNALVQRAADAPVQAAR